MSMIPDAEPTIDVNGVRISWDTARRRFARIFSRSTSSRICSCFLIWVVRALTLQATASMATKVSGYPVIAKFSLKYGNVKT